MKDRRKFIVTVDIPEGASVRDMEIYIREAVECWAKSFDPQNDPMFDLDPDSVRCRRMTAKTAK